VAFQLIDDVIDLSPEGTGKKSGTDLRAGVSTLPLLRLRQQASGDVASADLLERLERDVIGVSESDGDQVAADAAIAALREHAVTAQTLQEAHNWAHDAVDALAPLPAGPVKKALSRFADTIVERSS